MKEIIYKTTYKSPVGLITLASDGEKLIGLWNEGQKYHGDMLFEMIEKDDIKIFSETKKWLDRYFEGKKPSIAELLLAPRGGEFRQSVWKVLCDIPYGKIVTYGEIAKKLSKPPRAVGGAVGHNPISIIIPCHRVVGANGSLTGYAGGLATKIKLLKLEGEETVL